jgi:hypothetical protein
LSAALIGKVMTPVTIMSVCDLWRNSARLLQRADESDELVYAVQHGHPEVVFLGYQAIEALMKRGV